MSLATAAATGMTALNLMNTTTANNQNMKYLEKQRQAAARQKKNLLEAQLANRRAGLGAMGITSSKSAAAVQQRLAQDTYEEMADDNLKYEQQYKNLQRDNQYNLLNSIISTSGKIIK